MTYTILVTGATGYVGGRLVRRLVDRGHRVRCLVRDRDRVRSRSWEKQVDIFEGDALQPESLAPALEGVDVAYYLIHPLNENDELFVERNRRAADNFGKAARKASIKRIIYLGSLQPQRQRYSVLLQGRLETGEYLRQSRVPVTEFRAGVIIGSGSISFELIRYSTEHFPVLINPSWVNTRTQPIAIRNVLQYLLHALDVQESVGKIIEIGGEVVLTYSEMFRMYADIRGLKRLSIDVPVYAPRFSAFLISLVTPIAGTIVGRLIERLGNEMVVTDDSALEIFNIQLISYKQSVRLALRRFEADEVDTTWTDAASTSISDPQEVEELTKKEGMITERVVKYTQATPEAVFTVVCSIGGDTGWFYANSLWKIRGLIDMFVGGVGLRDSRRSYKNLRIGDTIDFWRVEAHRTNRLLRLRAEMKIPGKAWLQYDLTPAIEGGTHIIQTAYYEPKGMFGALYWYIFYIPHRLIFPGMLKELTKRAEALPEENSAD